MNLMEAWMAADSGQKIICYVDVFGEKTEACNSLIVEHPRNKVDEAYEFAERIRHIGQGVIFSTHWQPVKTRHVRIGVLTKDVGHLNVVFLNFGCKVPKDSRFTAEWEE